MSPSNWTKVRRAAALVASVLIVSVGFVLSPRILARLGGIWADAPGSLDGGSWEDVERQREDSDCGVAALAMLLRAYGVTVRYDDIARQLYGEGAPQGLSLLDLQGGAGHHGITLSGVRATSVATVPADGSWIARLGGEGAGHYVVVDSIVAETVFVRDPAAGRGQIREPRFHRMWSGYALVVLGEGK